MSPEGEGVCCLEFVADYTIAYSCEPIEGEGILLLGVQAVCWWLAGGLQVGPVRFFHLHFTCIGLYSPVQRIFSRPPWRATPRGRGRSSSLWHPLGLSRRHRHCVLRRDRVGLCELYAHVLPFDHLLTHHHHMREHSYSPIVAWMYCCVKGNIGMCRGLRLTVAVKRQISPPS